MESDEMQVEQMLKRTKKVFDKYKGNVAIKEYKKVLAAINIVPEDKETLEAYFDAVDLDGDGIISYDDFKECVLKPLMEEEESMDQGEDSQLSYAEQSLLTLEKLSEFKQMFKYHKKDKHASMEEMREDIISNYKGFIIKLPEFNAFFKDYEDIDIIKEDQFYEIYDYYEQKILEKAAVFDAMDPSSNPEIDFEAEDTSVTNQNDASHYMEEIIIGDQSDDGDNEKDPEVALQDIVDHIFDTGALEHMKPAQTIKIFSKIKDKVDLINTKMQTLEKKSTKFKNKNDILKNEKEYFHNKVGKLEETIESLKESKYKLEGDVEDLMKFEQDFQRMLRQNEDKDVEIIKLEDEIEENKRHIHSLGIQLQR